ncbi:hypothetical protein GEMRC1_005752 [Eukaryota sp. GEM-RC1]
MTTTNTTLQQGHSYTNIQHLQHDVYSWFLSSDKSFDITQKNQNRWDIRCGSSTPCPCYIHCFQDTDTHEWEIRKFVDHIASCQSLCFTTLPKQICAILMAEEVRGGKITSPSVFARKLKTKYFIDISPSKACRALEATNELLYGSLDTSYTFLEPFSKLNVAPDGTFERFFFTFQPLVKGFEFLRPVIVIDGTHLRSKYKGTLLAAAGIDTNGHFFPIAFEITRTENVISWRSFLENLNDNFAINDKTVFISDRNPAISRTLVEVFGEETYHSVCCKHLSDNLSSRGGKKAMKLFWKCARASTLNEFDRYWQLLQIQCPVGYTYLEESAPKESWSTVHFEGNRYGQLTSNIIESLNAWLLPVRSLPVTSMVNGIFEAMTHLFRRRKDESMKMHGEFVDDVEEYLLPSILRARSLEVTTFSDNLYSVRENEFVFSVDLKYKTCSCGFWKQHDVPCIHVMSVSRRVRIHPRSLVSPYYLVTNFKKTYDGEFYPIDYRRNIEELESDVFPPLDTVMPGRPPISRKDKYSRTKRFNQKRFDEKDASSDSEEVEPDAAATEENQEAMPLSPRRCGHCRIIGHDRGNCPEWIVLQQGASSMIPTVVDGSAPRPRQRKCRNCDQVGHDRRNCPTK